MWNSRFLLNAVPEALRDLATPDLLKIIPYGDLLVISKKIITTQVSKTPPDLSILRERLQRIGVQLEHEKSGGQADHEIDNTTGLSPREAGEVLLKIYFTMILHADLAMFDLRQSTLTKSASSVIWAPSPGHWQWTPPNQKALGEIYRGYFYADTPQFERGLKALGLLHAKDSFLAHFGDAAQVPVAFSFRAFASSFASIFAAHVRHKATLNAELLPLGILLGNLYRSLDEEDAKYDVKGIFYQVDSQSRDV